MHASGGKPIKTLREYAVEYGPLGRSLTARPHEHYHYGGAATDFQPAPLGACKECGSPLVHRDGTGRAYCSNVPCYYHLREQ